MREWNSYSDDLTLDGNVVKEYTIRFKTTEYEVYKRIEDFFQRLMDEPHTMDKCYKCQWWNYAYGCQNKRGICQFEAMADRKTEPQTERVHIVMYEPTNAEILARIDAKDEPQKTCFNCEHYEPKGSCNLDNCVVSPNHKCNKFVEIKPYEYEIKSKSYEHVCGAKAVIEDEPQTEIKGSKRLLKGSDEPQTDCPTCKWWSSYGYCVHRECKGYEPQERSE